MAQGASRAPYGARGLKYVVFADHPALLLSRPVWGAWIEIHTCLLALFAYRQGRAPYGARGLKFETGMTKVAIDRDGRAPYGARGLKYVVKCSDQQGRPGRAPYGARGLKFPPIGPLPLPECVAPRMGRVD